MRVLSLLILVLVLSACSANAFILRNRENIGHLEFGMTKDQVIAVMGKERLVTPDVRVSNPHRTAMHMEKDGAPTEVFFYWTDGTYVDGIQDRELTPVVFKNGKVVGWGREFWMEYVRKYEIRMR